MQYLFLVWDPSLEKATQKHHTYLRDHERDSRDDDDRRQVDPRDARRAGGRDGGLQVLRGLRLARGLHRAVANNTRIDVLRLEIDRVLGRALRVLHGLQVHADGAPGAHRGERLHHVHRGVHGVPHKGFAIPDAGVEQARGARDGRLGVRREVRRGRLLRRGDERGARDRVAYHARGARLLRELHRAVPHVLDHLCVLALARHARVDLARHGALHGLRHRVVDRRARLRNCEIATHGLIIITVCEI